MSNREPTEVNVRLPSRVTPRTTAGPKSQKTGTAGQRKRNSAGSGRFPTRGPRRPTKRLTTKQKRARLEEKKRREELRARVDQINLKDAQNIDEAELLLLLENVRDRFISDNEISLLVNMGLYRNGFARLNVTGFEPGADNPDRLFNILVRDPDHTANPMSLNPTERYRNLSLSQLGEESLVGITENVTEHFDGQGTEFKTVSVLETIHSDVFEGHQQMIQNAVADLRNLESRGLAVFPAKIIVPVSVGNSHYNVLEVRIFQLPLKEAETETAETETDEEELEFEVELCRHEPYFSGGTDFSGRAPKSKGIRDFTDSIHPLITEGLGIERKKVGYFEPDLGLYKTKQKVQYGGVNCGIISSQYVRNLTLSGDPLLVLEGERESVRSLNNHRTYRDNMNLRRTLFLDMVDYERQGVLNQEVRRKFFTGESLFNDHSYSSLLKIDENNGVFHALEGIVGRFKHQDLSEENKGGKFDRIFIERFDDVEYEINSSCSRGQAIEWFDFFNGIEVTDEDQVSSSRPGIIYQVINQYHYQSRQFFENSSGLQFQDLQSYCQATGTEQVIFTPDNRIKQITYALKFMLGLYKRDYVRYANADPELEENGLLLSVGDDDFIRLTLPEISILLKKKYAVIGQESEISLSDVIDSIFRDRDMISQSQESFAELLGVVSSLHNEGVTILSEELSIEYNLQFNQQEDIPQVLQTSSSTSSSSDDQENVAGSGEGDVRSSPSKLRPEPAMAKLHTNPTEEPGEAPEATTTSTPDSNTEELGFTKLLDEARDDKEITFYRPNLKKYGQENTKFDFSVSKETGPESLAEHFLTTVSEALQESQNRIQCSLDQMIAYCLIAVKIGGVGNNREGFREEYDKLYAQMPTKLKEFNKSVMSESALFSRTYQEYCTSKSLMTGNKDGDFVGKRLKRLSPDHLKLALVRNNIQEGLVSETITRISEAMGLEESIIQPYPSTVRSNAMKLAMQSPELQPSS